ncbi:MAG: type VI secretion system baseplate subunit TssG [Reinekea sp.]|jgi:type VI secretion system protein ImpH
MESCIWQQNPILSDILKNAHKYHFHQLLFLLEQLLPSSSGHIFDSQVRLRPDDSLAFPASDVRAFREISGSRYEVVARFMGLYGVDSPLPQYFLDEVTEGGESGTRLKAFLDIFNHRLYSLLHQVWKKQNLFTQLDDRGLYYRLVSGMTGQYWRREHDAMAFGGSFLGRSRDVESLEEILRETISLEELSIDDEVISWVAVEDGLQLTGQQALGMDTCLGNAIPMMGKKVNINVGPVDQSISDEIRPAGDMGKKMATLLRAYLPEGVDFDVSIQLTPKMKQDWILGSDHSLLAIHTQFGESSGRGLTFQLNSAQYFESA